jgi:RNA polymerase sigma-70 factor (ECF subfamily)
MTESMAGPPSDETLVDQAQGGNWEAFRVLYERYLPRVHNRLRALIPQEDVEDLTQEVFLAVVRSLGSFRGDSAFSTWLSGITKHKVSDYHRRKAKHGDTERSLLEEDCLPARDLLPTVQDRMLVRQILLSLPEQYREVLLLRFAEGLSFKEIAQLLNLSLEATKSLYRRAIAAAHKDLVGSDKVTARE